MAYKELATKDYVNNRVVTIIDSFESEQSNFTPDEILKMVSDKKILMINGCICNIYDMYYNEETNILEEVYAIISMGYSYMDFCIYGDKSFDLYRSPNFVDDETFWSVIGGLSETKQYELIKNITIESGGTSSLTIDTDQNNKPFSLSAIRINLGLLAGSSGQININCYNGTSIIGGTGNNPISIPTSSPKFEKFYIKNDHGIWVIDDKFLSVATNKYITSIKISTSPSTIKIPENSMIEVYGIRY